MSSPTIDRIKKDGVLFWAIGVSPPFGFELEPGVWAGVEAQNAAELATLLGVDFDIAEYSYATLPQALVASQADIVGAELFVTDARRTLMSRSGFRRATSDGAVASTPGSAICCTPVA